MDSVTFGAPITLRNFVKSEKKSVPILEVHLKTVLSELNISHDQVNVFFCYNITNTPYKKRYIPTCTLSLMWGGMYCLVLPNNVLILIAIYKFIDLCILLGCDYSDTIKGMGPVSALSSIRKFGSIEKIIENLDTKYIVPACFPYQEIRQIFKNSDVSTNNISKVSLWISISCFLPYMPLQLLISLFQKEMLILKKFKKIELIEFLTNTEGFWYIYTHCLKKKFTSTFKHP